MPDKLFEEVIYSGPSMSPTFRLGDLLCLTPYITTRIKRGDVVVFLSGQGQRKITHRVISVSQQGLKTQGDNSSKADQEILKPENILGRVDYIKRNGKQCRIWGGAAGLLYASFLRILRPVKRRIFVFLHYPYRFLESLNIFNRIPYVRSKIKVISFRRGSSEESQLLFGSRIIGRLLPGKNEWLIKRPFRIFIDSNFLLKQ